MAEFKIMHEESYKFEVYSFFEKLKIKKLYELCNTLSLLES